MSCARCGLYAVLPDSSVCEPCLALEERKHRRRAEATPTEGLTPRVRGVLVDAVRQAALVENNIAGAVIRLTGGQDRINGPAVGSLNDLHIAATRAIRECRRLLSGEDEQSDGEGQE